MLTLLVQDREGNTTQYPLDAKPEVILGRAAEVDVPLLSKNVSRRHAKVRLQGKRILVEDLGSSNGVIVNGTKIAGPTEISSGSEIQIGEFTVRIASQEAAVPEGPVASLTGQNGTFLDKVLPLKNGDNVVGRGSECDVFVADGSISRKHSILSISKDKVTVRDIGSANGTFVNGNKISDVVTLSHGDTVRFGSLSFKFELANPPVNGASLPASAPQPLPARQPSAAQPIAAKSSAAQPVIAKPSAPQPIQEPKAPSLKSPVVSKAPSVAVPVAAPAVVPPVVSAPAAPSGPVDWLKVGALLATPVIGIFFLGMLALSLFGGGSGSVEALRAKMSTDAAITQATAKKDQQDFIGAEEILTAVLQKNPGEPKARALYNAVHAEVKNQRLLQEAKTLKEQNNTSEALGKLSQIDPDSVVQPQVEALRQELGSGSASGTLRASADACEKGDYSTCLTLLCGYLKNGEPQDPDATLLARIALGLSSSAEKSCVDNPIMPPQQERSQAEVEKKYNGDPRKEYVLALLGGTAPSNVANDLLEAANNPANASQKKAFDETFNYVNQLTFAYNSFNQNIEAGDLTAAKKSAELIWSVEQSIFGKGVDGPLGIEARQKLLNIVSAQMIKNPLGSRDEWDLGKELLDRVGKPADGGRYFVLYYSSRLRFQAGLRDAYAKAEAAAAQDPEAAKATMKEILPYLDNKLKFKAEAQAKLK